MDSRAESRGACLFFNRSNKGFFGELGSGRKGCVWAVAGCVTGVSVDVGFSLLLGWTAGSTCEDFFAWARILFWRSSIVLSKTSSMAASRCGFSPNGESLMISRSEERPTEDLNLEWKRSCSILMMYSWLYGMLRIKL